MALEHVQPGQVIDLKSLERGAATGPTRTLCKSGQLEVIQLVLPQGKTIAEHKAPGEIVAQCLTGRVRFSAMQKNIDLEPGQLFYLAAAEPHAVSALEDCSVLLTIVLSGNGASR
jgi:quercetin dioxygenase-like cupin family protein